MHAQRTQESNNHTCVKIAYTMRNLRFRAISVQKQNIVGKSDTVFFLDFQVSDYAVFLIMNFFDQPI